MPIRSQDVNRISKGSATADGIKLLETSEHWRRSQSRGSSASTRINCRLLQPNGPGGKRFRAGSLHDRGAVIFDRALADAEIGGDVLAGIAGENHFHDGCWRAVSLAIRLAAASCQANNLVESLACSSARSTLASRSLAPIGFSKKSDAPAFIA